MTDDPLLEQALSELRRIAGVDEITGGLKNLARELEQDADMVLMLYRPAYYLREKCPPDQENICEILVAKNRGGPTGKTALYFHAETMRFLDAEPT